MSPRRASHFGVRITSLREVSEPPLRDHLSRQMKVTKAKALSIWPNCVATSYGLSSPCWAHAAHMLRFLHHTPRFASARRRSRARQAEAKRGRLVFVSPFGRAEQRRALRGARSAHQPLTSGGCLNAASEARVVSSARPAKTEQRKVALASRGPSRQGRFLSPLSLSIQRKGVGRRAELPARPHAVNKNNDKQLKCSPARSTDTPHRHSHAPTAPAASARATCAQPPHQSPCAACAPWSAAAASGRCRSSR
jgi:hypothetical protein